MQNELRLRRKLLETARKMNEVGINQGTSGNVSVRLREGLLITPSGMPYDTCMPEDLCLLRPDGSWEGKFKPSSEWRFHVDIYRDRPEIQAIIHTHSVFATSLACHGKDIPAFHYMIQAAGGKTIRCAPYRTFGTQELSDVALTALTDRKACLLANHGMIVLGHDLERALNLAVEVETLCEMYWRALQIGDPIILSDEEMAVIKEKFKNYGQIVKGGEEQYSAPKVSLPRIK